jgi:hypothetical protein
VKLDFSSRRRASNVWRMFENIVINRLFGYKTAGVTTNWKILHIDELHKLCVSQNIISVINPR